MKKIFGRLALTALLGIIPLSTASAYSISATAGNPTGNSQGSIIFDFDSTFPTIVPANHIIVPADASPYPSNNVGGQYARPLNDTTAYISVPFPNTNNTYVDISLGFFSNYLGLYWGSIDTYNSISFYNGSTALGLTILGQQVTSPSTANGNQQFLGTNLYVNITNLPTFDMIRVTSTQMAFEFDNIAASPVPEPATMLLFGAGIAGLAGIARRKNK